MAEHTKGPWDYRVEDLRDGRYHVVVLPGCDDTVDLHEEDNGEANARLIAAAPDMLAALQELMRVRDWAVIAGADKAPLPQDLIVKFAEMQLPAVDAARAAIAKATATPKGRDERTG